MSEAKKKEQRQCKTCPWRVGADPHAIPGYSERLHRDLKHTIVSNEMSLRGGAKMACHYSQEGNEKACAGWVNHQMGVGNNIGVRLQVMVGALPLPKVIGPQHERFEDTLPGGGQ